jgi:hypothetical protein
MPSLAKLTSVLILVVAMTGCATVNIEPLQASVSPYVAENIRNYSLNQTLVASVGDTVVKRRQYFSRTLTFHDRASPDVDFEFVCNVPLNREFRCRGTSGVEIPVAGNTSIDGTQYQVLQLGSTNNGLPVGMLIDRQTRQASGIGVWRNGFGVWDTKGGASFQVSPLPVFKAPMRVDVDKTKPFESIELVYTGLNGRSITLLYREFTPDDLARAAFFQNLTYDLSSSDTIAFKAFRIKVLEASNQSLRYVVIQD